MVAPHAGAWIETDYPVLSIGKSVAPHAGAWIETWTYAAIIAGMRIVAPHAGAWIETDNNIVRYMQLCRSPPTRGRGLKHVS